jgi:hypothetical protein
MNFALKVTVVVTVLSEISTRIVGVSRGCLIEWSECGCSRCSMFSKFYPGPVRTSCGMFVTPFLVITHRGAITPRSPTVAKLQHQFVERQMHGVCVRDTAELHGRLATSSSQHKVSRQKAISLTKLSCFFESNVLFQTSLQESKVSHWE